MKAEIDLMITPVMTHDLSKSVKRTAIDGGSISCLIDEKVFAIMAGISNRRSAPGIIIM